MDEPFSNLNCLPNDSSKSTYSELIDIFRKDPHEFWGVYAPLTSLDALDSRFTLRQERYLSYLLRSAERLVVDETQLHLHLPALARLTPTAHVVHLYRRASSFVTSHLRPSWSRELPWYRRAVRRLRHQYNQHVFWSRYDFPPGVLGAAVLGSHPQSKFGLLLEEAGYDAERIMAAPAYVRLLAYWHYHYRFMLREGPRLFDDRFVDLRYEQFAQSPGKTMRQLYTWIDLDPPADLSFPRVHRPKPPFREGDPRWTKAARMVGFDDVEIQSIL